MKVKELLPHLHFLMSVEIIVFDGAEESLFKGLVDNIPWWIADMELDTDDNGEAISIHTEEGEEPVLNIYVK